MKANSNRSARTGAVVIVSSAGGIGALIEFLSNLPKDFPLPIFIAQHLARNSPSILAELLNWRTGREFVWASSGTRPQPGAIYIVPPGSSLSLDDGRILISPLPDDACSWLGSVDDLLHSLLAHYGEGLVAITLSGMLAAGLSGLQAIRKRQGIVMAQSEKSSPFFAMPCAAIDFGKADIVFSPARMAEALAAIADIPSPRAGWPSTAA